MTEEIVENVSDNHHWLWAHWMKYFMPKYFYGRNPKSDWVLCRIPIKDWLRWESQKMRSYYDLSETEKESDRQLARQTIQNWTHNPYTGEKL